jgi:hypothetical protein
MGTEMSHSQVQRVHVVGGEEPMRAAGFAVVFVLSSAIVAAADPITFQLSGTVTEFFPDPSLGFSASPGDRFVAVLTLPSGLTDSQPGPRDATFLFHGSEAEFSLNVGSGELVGIGAGGFADVHLDNFLRAQFAFVFPARFPDESGHTASAASLLDVPPHIGA